MISEKVVRTTLWLSVLINVVSAYGLSFPDQFPATLLNIPTDAPPLYTFLLSYLIAGFGAAYAWAAMQTPISAPIVGVGAMGKIGLFAVTFLLWGGNFIETVTFMVTVFELLVGVIWLMWVLDVDRENTSD